LKLPKKGIIEKEKNNRRDLKCPCWSFEMLMVLKKEKYRAV